MRLATQKAQVGSNHGTMIPSLPQRIAASVSLWFLSPSFQILQSYPPVGNLGCQQVVVMTFEKCHDPWRLLLDASRWTTSLQPSGRLVSLAGLPAHVRL